MDLIIFTVPLALLWLAFPYIMGILAPFTAGFILYLAANPLNRKLKARLPGTVSAFLSLTLISVAVFFVVRILFSHLANEITSLTQSSGELYSDALPYISGKIASVSRNANASGIISAFFEGFRTQMFEIMTKFSTAILSFAKNIPSILISVFAAIFTAFFLLKDDDTFYSLLRKFFGHKVCHRFAQVKASFLTVTLSYLKAQLILESIIFSVLFIGFLCLKIKYALLTAFFTAIIDVVPVLGTGAVLIPMSVFNFLTGNSSLGWGILILYGTALLIRQLCEPKIVGNSLGIHPLLSVFSLYAGMKLLGVWGIILGPITAIFVKNLITVK